MVKASVAASLWERRVSEVFGVEDSRWLLSYRPRWVSEAVWLDSRELVLEFLLLARLGSAESARKALGPLVHFVYWGHVAGLPRDVQGFYTAEHVEEWREVAAQGAIPGLSCLSKPSVSDYTSRLQQMGPKNSPVTQTMRPWMAQALRFPFTMSNVSGSTSIGKSTGSRRSCRQCGAQSLPNIH